MVFPCPPRTPPCWEQDPCRPAHGTHLPHSGYQGQGYVTQGLELRRPYSPLLPPLFPLTLHPIMGLGKFNAGRIHQMPSAKSYLAAHPSWFDADPLHTCPRCGTDQEPFRHTILLGPAHRRARDLLLKDVDSVDTDSPIWNEPPLIKTLGQYISDTRTAFPPAMDIEIPPYPLPAAPSPSHPKV